MITMTFEGGQEIAAGLAQLSTRMSKKVTTEALLYAGEPVRQLAGQIAPRHAPHPDMADHIAIAPLKPIEGETAAVAIGPEPPFYYSLMQELGWVFGAAQPFMRPAFDQRVGQVLDRFRGETWRQLAARGISRVATSDGPVTGGPGGGGLR